MSIVVDRLLQIGRVARPDKGVANVWGATSLFMRPVPFDATLPMMYDS